MRASNLAPLPAQERQMKPSARKKRLKRSQVVGILIVEEGATYRLLPLTDESVSVRGAVGVLASSTEVKPIKVGRYRLEGKVERGFRIAESVILRGGFIGWLFWDHILPLFS